MKCPILVRLRKVAVRVFSAGLCTLALVVGLIAVPALAANLDYNDYITDAYVDGDNDVVKVALPYDNAYSVVVEYDDDDPTGSPIASGPGGTISWYATADMFYYIDTYPLGPSMASGDKLDLTNIPDGSVLTVTFSCDLECSGYGTPHHDVWIYYCDASNNVVGSIQNTAGTFVPGDKPAAVSFTLDKPSGAVSLYFCVQVDDLQPNYSGTVTFTLESVDLELSISALYFLQKQTGRTNELLEKVNDQLEEQGKTLDDILTGGEAGEDLVVGGDRIEDAGADLGEDIGQIQDFEDQYFGQLEDNMDEVIAGADLTFLYPSLYFVQRYLNMIVGGIPSKYMIVFTLPMFFGIFMYIVGHPIRAPRPDTSGDTVTRETFTTTTVLEGKHRGATTTTRTVTTSQEIGRVHNE